MKRYMALIFSVVMVFCVAGCGASNGNTSLSEPVKTASDKGTIATEGAGNNLKGKKF